MNGDTDRRPGATAPRPAEAETPMLCADVIVRDDGREECTIYPAEPNDEEYVTVWITATDDAFVPIDEIR